MVQPTGQAAAPRAAKQPSKPQDSSRQSSRLNLRRLRSDDSSASADASSAMPATSLGSPPSSPISIGTASISTPTSSGGGSTPGLWTPTTSPKLTPWCRRSDSEPGEKRRRHSIGSFPETNQKRKSRLRRWYSCFEVTLAAGTTIRRAGRQLSKSPAPINGTASAAGPTPPPVPPRPTAPPVPPRPSQRQKQYTKPPPLDLRALTNGTGPKTPGSASSGRTASASSTTTACTFATTANGGASASSNHASLLKKSKAILASISSVEEEDNGENGRSGASLRNPFPVKRQTALIERGKRLGLYS